MPADREPVCDCGKGGAGVKCGEDRRVPIVGELEQLPEYVPAPSLEPRNELELLQCVLSLAVHALSVYAPQGAERNSGCAAGG